jgi:hypothetical protein
MEERVPTSTIPKHVSRHPMSGTILNAVQVDANIYNINNRLLGAPLIETAQSV